jgi:hypothetical protein
MLIDTIILTTRGIIDEDHLRLMKQRHYVYDGIDSMIYTYPNTRRMQSNQVYVLYVKGNHHLRIHIPSISRFYFGTSAIMMEERLAPWFFNKLHNHLVKELGVTELPHPSEWKVTKMDIYYDFDVGSNAPSYIEALRQKPIGGYKRIMYENESIYWKCKSRELKVYNRHANSIDKKWDGRDIRLCEGILRFEVTVKKAELIKKFGGNTFGEVIHEDVIYELLQHHFGRLKVSNLAISTAGVVLQQLCERYSEDKALKLFGYIVALSQQRTVKLSAKTISRYYKDIQAAGVAPVIGTTTLPPLVIVPKREDAVQKYLDYKFGVA